MEPIDPVGRLGFARAGRRARAASPAAAGAFVAVADAGRGHGRRLGGAGLLTNGALGEVDNAVLAAALLAPAPGTRVAVVLLPAAGGGGTRSLADLVSPGVKGALLQLGVAFVLYALWRARRLGRPVPEPQPVPLAASELVVAVGQPAQQAGRRDQAGALLRADLRRRLAERLGLALDAAGGGGGRHRRRPDRDPGGPGAGGARPPVPLSRATTSSCPCRPRWRPWRRSSVVEPQGPAP